MPDSDLDAPLRGLTVLDLSQGVAGPYCGAILCQQGARVIKVEPAGGDWVRHMGRSRGGVNALALAYNAGKESVVLDTRTEEGRTALRRIALRADVVIQNFRPGVAERMGVGYEGLAAHNPRLIYASVSGWGPSGPSAHLPALDTTVQAVTGLMHMNRDPAGRPRRIGFFVVDIATALYAAHAVAMALYRLALEGRGRHVEVSMLQTAAALQCYQVVDDAMFPEAESALFAAPAGLYDTADGMLYVSTVNDAMFARLARALGCEDWLADASLATGAGRMPRADALNARVAECLAGESTAHWVARLTEHDVLFGEVRRPSALVADPQAVHAGIFTTLDQPDVGPVPWAGLPGHGARQPAPGRAPRLGEHTEAVLREFGTA